MKYRPTSQPTKVLTHPNDPSVTVTVRKPTRREGMKYAQALAEHQRAIPVRDENGLDVLDADGIARTYVQQTFPLAVVMESLRMTVIAWSGIADEAGNPIPFTTADETLFLPFEEFLDVVEAGKPNRSFSKWISEQTSKPAFFDPDPTPGASLKP